MSTNYMEHGILSRSMLLKKYSSCPLKKRPFPFKDDSTEAKDAVDISEPENLSTKPQDLTIFNSSPPPAKKLTLSLSEKFEAPETARERSHPTAFTVPQRDTTKPSGGVLEPLNLNTAVEPPPIPITHRPTPQYPEGCLLSRNAYYYSTHDFYHQYHPSMYPMQPIRIHQEQAFPFQQRESCSPPLYPSPVRPVPALARPTDKPYFLYPHADHSGLSPTSTVSRSTPPATPEDLSSPGSVASTSSSGSGQIIISKKKKESTPRYQCPDCNKSYSTYSGLSKHQQFHCAANEASQAKKSFTCKFCDKIYSSLGALKMHIRTHTLPCKCTVCGKAFSRPWLLQGHVRTHTGEKPFSCQHCGRAFADRSNLRAHLQTHSDTKKYSCTSCSKSFSRMNLLSKHMEGGCPGMAPQPEILYQQIPGISDLSPENLHR